MKNIKIGTLIINLIIPLGIGLLSATLSKDGMMAYGSMNKPPLSPPPYVFSVAWTILYLMMGLSTYYLVSENVESGALTSLLMLYGAQLLMNFMWSILFFNYKLYLFSFFWLIIMLCLVIMCAIRFFEVSKMAAYLLIPYILWLSFASYLNMGAYVLNM